LLLLSTFVLIVLFSVAFVWATTAPFAITATATGKVAPPDRVQVISYPEPGAIKSLGVRVGEHVTAGQTLVELDRSSAAAELDQVQSDIVGLQAEMLRLQAEQQNVDPDFASVPPAKALEQAALLAARRARHAGELAVAEGELKATQATIAGTEAALVPLRHRLAGRRELVKSGYGSTFQMNEDETRVGELSGRQQEAVANEQRARARLVAVEQAYREDVAKSLADAMNKLSGFQQVLPKYQHRLEALTLVAPVAGRIKTVAVSGLGAAIRPGDPIVEIVPDDAKQLVLAKLPAAEIGHVHPGQAVRISLLPGDNHFKPMDGTVKTVAPDSTADEHSGQLTYVVEIEPDQAGFPSHGDQDTYPLTPGVPVVATIITGNRSVLSAIAGPLFAELDTALTER
jgi:HlyD family type I secretion membrane fusion protein